MSSDGPATPRAARPDYTRPMARAGEEQFACIVRNRSGVDAGELDYVYRSPPKDWPAAEKANLATTALLLYELIAEDMGTCGSEVVVRRMLERMLDESLGITSDNKPSEGTE